MKRKYCLGEKVFWIEMVDLKDDRLDIVCAKLAVANILMSALKDSRADRLLVTATFPHVYMRTSLPEGLSANTYYLSFRTFLGFISNLTKYHEIQDEIDWIKYGF